MTSDVDDLPFPFSFGACWTLPGAPWGEGTFHSSFQEGSLVHGHASASSPCAYDCQEACHMLEDVPVIEA